MELIPVTGERATMVRRNLRFCFGHRVFLTTLTQEGTPGPDVTGLPYGAAGEEPGSARSRRGKVTRL